VDVLALAVIVALLAGTLVLLAGPLRAAARGRPGDRGEVAEERASLEAAKQAKYREIRETELDFRTGKLSEEDFRATDRALRAEAAQLLGHLDALAGGPGEEEPRGERGSARGGADADR